MATTTDYDIEALAAAAANAKAALEAAMVAAHTTGGLSLSEVARRAGYTPAGVSHMVRRHQQEATR